MIKWIKKTRNSAGKRLGDKDIYIQHDEKCDRWIVRMYDTTAFGEATRIKIGLDGDRLYLAPAEDGEPGWSLTDCGNTKRTTLTSPYFKGFEGSYDLKYDRVNSLHYVERGPEEVTK